VLTSKKAPVPKVTLTSPCLKDKDPKTDEDWSAITHLIGMLAPGKILHSPNSSPDEFTILGKIEDGIPYIFKPHPAQFNRNGSNRPVGAALL